MANEDSAELEKRVADLTQRIYHIEQLLATGQFLPGSVPKPPKPAQAPSVAVPHPPDKPSSLPSSLQKQVQTPAPSIPQRSLESMIGSQWLNRIGILAMMV